MPPPNVLWICTDQQRYDTLGCTGNRFVRTPHLDRLAEEGVQFEHGYSQSPVCTPSRASFLTGRYPRTTRCRQNGQSILADEILVTKVLHDAGYTCGLSGKLHLSACNPRACKGTERRIEDGYDAFHWSHHPKPDWPTNEYGVWLAEHGAEYRTPPRADCRFVLDGMPAELHQTSWCVDKAIGFIEAAKRFPRPWLFSVNVFDPHHPFDPPPEYLERYLPDVDDIPLPNYVEGELERKPEWQRTDHGGAYGGKGGFRYAAMSARDHRLVRAAYWAMVDLIDAQVGRLLAALDRSGQRENTLVIFTSDHGEMLGDHGIYLKGPYFYEPAVRVPLLVRLPGRIAAGRRTPALVELADLAPTLLDACGLPRQPGMQARSLWPLLTGAAPLEQHRDDIYCESYDAHVVYATPAHATMVRSQRHKLVLAHGRHTGELYDLEQDPTETVNRWDDPDCAEVRTEMLVRLADRMAWTVDPLPIRQTEW